MLDTRKKGEEYAMATMFTGTGTLIMLAGIGLAGELGAGITLVAETLPKDKRGWGTMIVASFGICGAILAGFVADIFDAL